MLKATLSKPKPKNRLHKKTTLPFGKTGKSGKSAGNAVFENCDAQPKRKTAKKKTMTKVGCWRGLFAGTKDF